MFNYIYTGECFISYTTIGYPTCHLCSKFYVQFVISTVKSRQISNIHTHGFLLKCKKHFFTNGPIKIAEKKIKTLSWNYNGTRYIVMKKCIELVPLESEWFVSCLLEKLIVAGKKMQVLESDKSIKSKWLLQ